MSVSSCVMAFRALPIFGESKWARMPRAPAVSHTLCAPTEVGIGARALGVRVRSILVLQRHDDQLLQHANDLLLRLRMQFREAPASQRPFISERMPRLRSFMHSSPMWCSLITDNLATARKISSFSVGSSTRSARALMSLMRPAMRSPAGFP